MSPSTVSTARLYPTPPPDNKRVVFLHLQKLPPPPSPSPPSPALSVRQLSWFSSESLAPLAIAFNPLGDYALLVTSSLHLLVVSMAQLLPDSRVYGAQSSSGLGWEGELITRLYGGPGDEAWGAPSSLLWWETSDFLQLALVGTQSGVLVVVNLVTRAVVGTARVNGPIQQLEVLVDGAMDCVHAIISSADCQWRLLLEQRSTGYVWGGEGGEGAAFLPCLEAGQQQQEEGPTRRRLSGLRQMSVEKIANIRQRLAEGRRLLRTRSESEDLARYEAEEEGGSITSSAQEWCGRARVHQRAGGVRQDGCAGRPRDTPSVRWGAWPKPNAMSRRRTRLHTPAAVSTAMAATL